MWSIPSSSSRLLVASLTMVLLFGLFPRTASGQATDPSDRLPEPGDNKVRAELEAKLKALRSLP